MDRCESNGVMLVTMVCSKKDPAFWEAWPDATELKSFFAGSLGG